MVPMPDSKDAKSKMDKYLQCQKDLDRIEMIINTRATLIDMNALEVSIDCDSLYLYDKRVDEDDKPLSQQRYHLEYEERGIVEQFIKENLFEIFNYIRATRLEQLKQAALEVREVAKNILTLVEYE